MPAKWNKKYKSALLNLKAKQVTDEMQSEFVTRMALWIKGEVRDSIEKGLSPVDQKNAYPKNTGGKSRYQGYSDSYKDQINSKNGKLKNAGKRIRPVNLKVSGKLLNSLKSKKFRTYLRLWFADEKAKYHNVEGAGKSKVIRRILPRGIEEFSRPIQSKIIETAAVVIKKLL